MKTAFLALAGAFLISGAALADTASVKESYVAGAFSCLAMTLEQPFKDSAITPEPVAGWSPARCRRLGAATLDALAPVIERMR